MGTIVWKEFKPLDASGAEVQVLFNIGPPTLRKLLGAGAPHRRTGTRLSINVPDMIDWFVAMKMSGEENRTRRTIGTRGTKDGPHSVSGGDVIDFQKEKARSEKGKADNLELKNAQLREELVDAAEVRAHYADLVANFRTRMRALPAKMAPTLPLKKTPAEIQAAMLKGIDDALRELTDE